MRASRCGMGDPLNVMCGLAMAILGLFLGSRPGQGDELSALARLQVAATSLDDRGQGLSVVLGISQPVPYRISFLDNPPRLIVDFREVDFGTTAAAAVDHSDRVQTLAWGPFLSGWSRMVATLDVPLRLKTAQERRGPEGSAVISMHFVPTTRKEFSTQIAETSKGTQAADWALPAPAKTDAPILRQTGEAPLKVVLDPGHGGIDPGAESGKTTEAAVILGFSLELAEVLRRSGMKVDLTRQTDVFVPLETRISVARAAGADVFLSLHADALAEGEATGATIYTLSAEANDTASEQLAERHDRADLLAGIDLSGQGDDIADVLMAMARTETQPRADKLALALQAAIQGKGLKMHRRPIQAAAFSVLKSADIPSLLLEVGFLSSEKDRARLEDPIWRADLQAAIAQALAVWAISDAAEARLIRQ